MEQKQVSVPKYRPFVENVKKGDPNLTPALPNLTQTSKKATPNLTSSNTELFEYIGKGRELNFATAIEMLTYVYQHQGEWPSEPDRSPAMRRHYRRQYPWFFAEFDQTAQEELEKRGIDKKTAATLRTRDQQKAARLRAENRPSRARVKKGVKKGGTDAREEDAKFDVDTPRDVKKSVSGERSRILDFPSRRQVL